MAQAARKWQCVDGVLLVDKPYGPSSNGVLQHVRRVFNAAKAGHGGTLDPMATGLLIVCFGEATKYSSGLLESEKQYTGTICLGVRTSTGDAEGQIIERAPVRVDPDMLEAASDSLLGEIEQTPPAFSAIKVNGQPSYAYARAGVDVVRAARRVTIHSFELKQVAAAELEFVVRCSSGTYVRTLAEDLARALGTVAHLGSLRRLASGPFDVKGALTPQALEALSSEAQKSCLLPVDAPLYALPSITLMPAAITSLQQGKHLVRRDEPEGKSRLYSPEGDFAGVVEATADGRLIPVRMTRSHDTAN